MVVGSCCLCGVSIEAEEARADAAGTLYGSLFWGGRWCSKAGSYQISLATSIVAGLAPLCCASA